MTAQQLQYAKEIATFGTERGYDMENLTPELLNRVMKHWLEVGKDFHERVTELPLHQKKQLMGLS